MGKFVLQWEVAARNDLTAGAGFEVDDDRRFEIECEAFAVLSDDNDDLGLPHIGERQGA